MKKKLLCLLLCVALLSACCVTAQAKKSGESFDEGNVILRMGLMSDLHFDAINTYTENYANNTEIIKTSVNFLKDKLGEDQLRAIIIGGDIANWNGLADLQMARDAFDQCLSPLKTELIPTVGNHDDWCTNGKEPTTDPLSQKSVFASYNLFSEKLGAFVYWNKSLTSKGDLIRGYYHTKINGVHILSLVGIDGNHGDTALQWFDKEMQKIRESEDKGHPVFVVTHTPPRNTAEGTISKGATRWTSDSIARYAKKYPEVVFVTGHTHSTANSANVLWQTDSYSVLHSGCIGEGEHSFATLEIDKNYHVRYTGYQVVADEAGWKVQPFSGRTFVFSVNEIVEEPSSAETSSKKETGASKKEESSVKEQPSKSVTSKTEPSSSASKADESEMINESEASVPEELSEEQESIVPEDESKKVTDVIGETSADEKENPTSNAWIYIVIGAVVLIGVGVGVFFLMKKKKDEEQA